MVFELDYRNRCSDDVRIAMLWREYFNNKSDEYRECLFEVYQEFAKRLGLSLFKKYSMYGVSVDDILQNAYLGLYIAIDKYQLFQGARFETFAGYRIKGEVVNGLKYYSEAFDFYNFRKKLEKERIGAIVEAGGTKNDVHTLLSIALNLVASSIVEFAESEVSGLAERNETEHTISAKNIIRLIDRLPDVQRNTLTMHFFYDYSFADIAEVTHLSKSAVYKNFCKGLEMIRRQLAQFDKDIMVV